MKKMEKKKIRIGELARHLDVEKFVIRFWEKEFSILGQRSNGGQRCYNERDLKKFETIKELLYNQGFTIAGAKKHLKSAPLEKSSIVQAHSPEIIASHITTLDESGELYAPENKQELPQDISQQIIELQRKLVKLRELL